MIALALLGCASLGPAPLPQAWAQVPGEHALVGELWRDLDGVPADWHRFAPSVGDIPVAQWWCSPETDPDSCWTGAVTRGEARPSAWRALAAPTNGQGELRRLALDLGEVPAGEPWGVGLTLWLLPDGAVEHWELVLTRWAGERLTTRFALGPTLHQQHEQTDFSAEGPAWDALVASPEDFVRVGTAAFAALKAEADARFDAGEVQRCAYGRFYGDGSPRCDLVPLSGDEARAGRGQVQAELDHRIRLLETDGPVLHQRLVDLLPGTLRR